jgi:hypothetical protein
MKKKKVETKTETLSKKKKKLHSHISAETTPAHHAPTHAAPAWNPTGLRTRSTSTESKEDTF